MVDKVDHKSNQQSDSDSSSQSFYIVSSSHQKKALSSKKTSQNGLLSLDSVPKGSGSSLFAKQKKQVKTKLSRIDQPQFNEKQQGIKGGFADISPSSE